MLILGISAYYHDSAACILLDNKILAAASEERFSRKKNDASFPEKAISFCLQQAGIKVEHLDAVAYYENPALSFDRILSGICHNAPFSLPHFLEAMPQWLSWKLNLKKEIQKRLNRTIPIHVVPHHVSHAASAFYPSPFNRATILTVDGVGEWATTMISRACNGKIEPLEEIHYPHSLGLLYSAFTHFLGFKVNEGEYKVMGLAPYGTPRFKDVLLKHFIQLNEDGSFSLNLKQFQFQKSLNPLHKNAESFFETPIRKPDSPLLPVHCDIAASLQEVLNDAICALARRAMDLTGENQLCMSGGVALNCTANARILKKFPECKLWIQPAAGDAGGALGCALSIYHEIANTTDPDKTSMEAALLGPQFHIHQIKAALLRHNLQFHHFLDEESLITDAVNSIKDGKVTGWFQGRMEFGPRALGARSILADPRDREMQSKLNKKIKFRESFRPFAPSVLKEHAHELFEMPPEHDSPYMLFTFPLQPKLKLPDTGEHKYLDRLKHPHSPYPAITHVNYTARIQTVDAKDNPLYHRLISEFHTKTGCPMVLNTSMNVRGEPIVCTPEDAIHCFLNTDMDVLYLEQIKIEKEKK
jgi:carbamoyltransferase